jgi:hypothetical protein
VIILYRHSPEIRKLAKVHGLTPEEAMQAVVAGQLRLPETLPLSPEEARQAFEDELIEAMARPVPPDYFGQTL